MTDAPAATGPMVVIGVGSSLVTIAAFALSLVIPVYAGLLAGFGWLRPVHRS